MRYKKRPKYRYIRVTEYFYYPIGKRLELVTAFRRKRVRIIYKRVVRRVKAKPKIRKVAKKVVKRAIPPSAVLDARKYIAGLYSRTFVYSHIKEKEMPVKWYNPQIPNVPKYYHAEYGLFSDDKNITDKLDMSLLDFRVRFFFFDYVWEHKKVYEKGKYKMITEDKVFTGFTKPDVEFNQLNYKVSDFKATGYDKIFKMIQNTYNAETTYFKRKIVPAPDKFIGFLIYRNGGKK